MKYKLYQNIYSMAVKDIVNKTLTVISIVPVTELATSRYFLKINSRKSTYDTEVINRLHLKRKCSEDSGQRVGIFHQEGGS